MQQPIRYYITKSGDEPTVRSVKVALGDVNGVGRARDSAIRVDSPAEAPRRGRGRLDRAGVRHLVKRAVKKRSAKD